MCSNLAAVRVFRNCGQKIVFYGFQRSREALFRRAFCLACARILLLFGQKIVFYGFQRSREALFRRAFCLTCARILLLFECFGTADKRLFFMDSKKVTWGTFSACVLLTMCSNPAAVRVFRNCGQKSVFYGFQRSREALFRRAFCFACARILLLFECFGTADKRLFFMDSKGHVRHFFGVRFAYHVLESCCCSSVSELRTKGCFLWIPKVTWGTFSACVLLSMCSNPVAVRVFRNCGQKSCCCSSVSELRTKDCFLWIPKVTWGTFSACVLLIACARILLLFECFGTAGKRLFFMDSKGHVRHLFDVRFV